MANSASPANSLTVRRLTVLPFQFQFLQHSLLDEKSIIPNLENYNHNVMKLVWPLVCLNCP